jgi:hypothetical protein
MPEALVGLISGRKQLYDALSSETMFQKGNYS